MKYKNFFFSILFGLLSIFVMLPSSSDVNIKNSKPFVISTIAPIFSIVSFITGDDVASDCLIGFSSDPHGYQIVKGDADKIMNAEIVFANGLGLEHGVSLVNMINTKKIFDAGAFLKSNFDNRVIRSDNVDDPHIWMDLSIMIDIVDPICSMLCDAFPEFENNFKQRASLVKQRLGDLHVKVINKFNKIDKSKRFLVTSHDAFKYFVRAYIADEDEINDGTWSRRSAAPEGFAPEGQISIAKLNEVIRFIRSYSIKTIFQEFNVNSSPLEKIKDVLSREGVRTCICSDLIYSDTFPQLSSAKDILESYEYMISYNTDIIARGLDE